MLTSVTAELPAFLVPPASRESGRDAAANERKTPADDRVELSADDAEAANSREPESPTYGRDGRFVAVTSESERYQDSGANQESAGRQNGRELTLAEFDAVVPPAAREELRALADRVNEQASTQSLEPKDYMLISDLMMRVGRYTEALDAERRAAELEEPGANALAASAPSADASSQDNG
ncbi:MAG: hypothetical protein IPK83_12335 [Planctomycetes bacterium]|nr:hypothetical protein [Planctomycetota bacterium]